MLHLSEAYLYAFDQHKNFMEASIKIAGCRIECRMRIKNVRTSRTLGGQSRLLDRRRTCATCCKRSRLRHPLSRCADTHSHRAHVCTGADVTCPLALVQRLDGQGFSQLCTSTTRLRMSALTQEVLEEVLLVSATASREVV